MFPPFFLVLGTSLSQGMVLQSHFNYQFKMWDRCLLNEAEVTALHPHYSFQCNSLEMG
jgi:hypothetical protein